MFGPDTKEPVDAAKLPEAITLKPDESEGGSSKAAQSREDMRRRHSTLIQCLRDERDLQLEERTQMAIDHDYYDHLQWREEDAAVLIERGQAPLVFNEARQSIDWVCGIQRRQRTDDAVLPREKNDEKSAEIKSKYFKFVSDTNLAPWHESQAYKSAVIGGLGWLEEGINTNPGEHKIYSGSEDWRNVYRDSRSRQFDQKDARFQFRHKRIDLDYAIALLPQAKAHLIQHAGQYDERMQDDLWYLGERLTGSTDLTGSNGYLPSQFGERSAYIGGSQNMDHGRRLSVDMIEAWYRVPETVQVFGNGPLRGKEYNPKDAGHQQLESDRWKLYQAVTMRMRVMVCTESAPLWDGKSPFRHQNFLLVPVWGYRRGRDGQCYGLMRGMRDINDDINKRASKALYAASSNRMTFEAGTFEDIEEARREAARPDMALSVKRLDAVRFEKPMADMQMNMELLSFDREMLRNTGGVTDPNLGRGQSGQSGKAIGLLQDQGSLTTSDFPENLRLAKQMAGRLRLSHIEQFVTEQEVVRIVGDSSPIEWITINETQPDGTILNDIASNEADYIIGEINHRETFAQAAMESMMELLGKIATYAPQVVMNVLDLVVDSAEIQNKDEWVARIRALNGQRDPTKQPTPEELAAKQKAGEEEARAKAIQLDTLQAGLDKLRAEVSKLDTGAMLQRVESMFSALQAAQIVAMTPNVAPVADTIAAGAGFKDQQGMDPNLPQPDIPMPPQTAMPADMGNPMADVGIRTSDPGMPMPDPGMPPGPQGLEGVQAGIQTPMAADNGPAM